MTVLTDKTTDTEAQRMQAEFAARNATHFLFDAGGSPITRADVYAAEVKAANVVFLEQKEQW